MLIMFMIIINILLGENKETEDAGEIVKKKDAGEIVKTEDAGEIVKTEDEGEIVKMKDAGEIVKTKGEVETKETVVTENTSATKETFELKEDEKESSKVVGEEHELPNQADERQENRTEHQNKEAEGSNEDTESNTSKMADDENRSTVSKLYVHSQWLSVQSPYFKALFYSGLKETYSKEVIMKIYEHELQAHLTLIEAMYKLDVLSDKDCHLVVQVLVLAHKYDVHYVIKKCKYILLSTTPSLEMCEYILREIKHLSDTADIYEMLEKFLVKEFTPIDETYTLDKFTGLSEAVLRLLLRSDSLDTRSEDTVFVALMQWVILNIPSKARDTCDLLDLVRFEFMSVDFLYDVVQDHSVASRMPGFTKYLVKGLAYNGFSQKRREQFEPKPKKRHSCNPTFSWKIDEELEEKLTTSPGTSVFSDKFCYQGYSMQLQLRYKKDVNNCGFFFAVRDLVGEACLNASYRAKSTLFASNTIRIAKRLFTAEEPDWGFGSLECNTSQKGKGYTIDIWVEIH